MSSETSTFTYDPLAYLKKQTTQELLQYQKELITAVEALERDYGCDSLSDAEFDEIGRNIADTEGTIEDIKAVLSTRMKQTTDDINFYERLDKLRQAYPDLTFDNDGYENIPDDVRERNLAGNQEIEELLRAAVFGFVKFQNFKPRKDGSFAVRCQTRWNERFTGVSYFPLENFKPGHPSWQQASEQDFPTEKELLQ